jgi:hypothetical protein
MAGPADDLGNDVSIVVVNPDDDASVEALRAWIDGVEREGDWIDLPATASQLIDEDRTAHES